jgi:hypothetical protein
MDSNFHATKSTTRDDRLVIQALHQSAGWETTSSFSRNTLGPMLVLIQGKPLKTETFIHSFGQLVLLVDPMETVWD